MKAQNRRRKNKLHAKLKISDLFPKIKPTIDQAEAAAVQSCVSSVAFRFGNKCYPIELLLAQSLKGNPNSVCFIKKIKIKLSFTIFPQVTKCLRLTILFPHSIKFGWIRN